MARPKKKPSELAETAKAETTAPKQLEPFCFQPGQSGNPAGRPKGSRNKLGEAFIEALHDDFNSHGVAAIQQVRQERPHEYMKVIASILPKEMKISVDEYAELSDSELDHRIKQLARALSLEIGNGESAEGEGAPQTLQ